MRNGKEPCDACGGSRVIRANVERPGVAGSIFIPCPVCKKGELATIAMVQIEAVLGMNYREGIERTERRRG